MSTPTRVVLLSCGSFNPVTNMHLRMFELARDSLHKTGRYRVIGGIISPVADGYPKKGLLSKKHRTSMLELALKSTDWVRMDTWECDRETWLETALVMRHHKEKLDSQYNANLLPDTPTKKRKLDRENSPVDEVEYAVPSTYRNRNKNEPPKPTPPPTSGPVQLKLLCGADLLESFGTPGLWKEDHMDEIVGKHGLVCISRSGSNADKFIYESDLLYKNQNNIHLITEWITNDISSTKIRRALQRGESVKYLLQDSVINYIHEHQLYGAGDNKNMNYITPSPNNDEPETKNTEPEKTENGQANMDLDLDLNYLSPNQYRRFENRRSLSDDTSENLLSADVIPVRRHSARSITCMGADLSGLVRRVKNMRVAVTPETCV